MPAPIFIGCSQITWKKVPLEQVLQEIAQAGYEGAPAGPSAGRTAAQTIELYARYGLRPAPGYFSADYWKPEKTREILDRAAEVARVTRELGLSEIFVACGGGDYVTRGGRTRRQLSGHVGPGDGLSDDEFKRFCDVLSRVGGVMLREGVKACYHNHVGTPIETQEEYERMIELSDPASVFLGPDTGHLAWAGGDVIGFCRKYASRIKAMHLKEINEQVRQRGRDAGWDYDTFTKNGIFAELGEGPTDFAALLQILRSAGFEGWLIAETDVTQKPTAFESARISREHLRRLGI